MRTIALAAAILIGSCTPGASASDAGRYVGPVQTYADNVLAHGRDNLGPKHTPLFIDGINVDTLQPPVWKVDGQDLVLSNLASQQNLMRVLDGLTQLTGEQKYRGAAVRAIRYAFDNLQAPNGLMYWGGHYCYDAGRDVFISAKGKPYHELKTHYPYYELMYQVDPDAAARCMEAALKGHIYDWTNLDMNRHATYDRDTSYPWPG